MTDTLDLDARRRRIRYRAWHRGLRELELLMGPLVNEQIDTFDTRDIADFEALLDENDQTVLGWLLGDAPPAPGFDTPVFARLRAFRPAG
jgi:antitoxin CptB